jgi:hypothetical protein
MQFLKSRAGETVFVEEQNKNFARASPLGSCFCCTSKLQQTVSCGIDGTQGLKASPIPEEDNSTLQSLR